MWAFPFSHQFDSRPTGEEKKTHGVLAQARIESPHLRRAPVRHLLRHIPRSRSSQTHDRLTRPDRTPHLSPPINRLLPIPKPHIKRAQRLPRLGQILERLEDEVKASRFVPPDEEHEELSGHLARRDRGRGERSGDGGHGRIVLDRVLRAVRVVKERLEALEDFGFHRGVVRFAQAVVRFGAVEVVESVAEDGLAFEREEAL